MREEVEKIEYKGFNIEVYHDENAESPRDWDNFGNMVCWHSKYILGDKHEFKNVVDFLLSINNLLEDNPLFDNKNDVEMVEILTEKFEKSGGIILPLYLYDHSILSIKTFRHGQHSAWDCGQVGFTYATKKEILENFQAKKLNKGLKDIAEELLEAEIEPYNDYIQGSVYGFKIIDSEGIEHDSLWGFYGYNHDKSGLLSEAKGQIDYIVYEQKKLQLQY